MKIVLLAATASLLSAFGMVSAESITDGFESGHIDVDKWQLDQDDDCTIEISKAESRNGTFALAMHAGTNTRCEVVPLVYTGFIGQYRREPYGERRTYEFSTYMKGPWRPGEQNEIIAQWHGTADKFLGDTDSRGPPLAIRIYGSEFRITYGWDADFISSRKWLARLPLWTNPIVTDRWLDWRIQARWSHAEDGILRIWLNDDLIVEHDGPNAYNDLRGVYLKLGPYHADEPRTLFIDDVHIGPVEVPGR